MKIRFCLCHAIRGQYGDDATMEQMHGNIQQAIKWAEYLREQLPGGEFYCPGEHEGLFQQAWLQGLITSDQILHQSKAIVRLCDVVLIMTDPEDSGGVRSEITEAFQHKKFLLGLYLMPQIEWIHHIKVNTAHGGGK